LLWWQVLGCMSPKEGASNTVRSPLNSLSFPAVCLPAVREARHRRRKDASSLQTATSVRICFSHFFDSWKQHRSGEGGQSRPHSLRRVAVGAKRRALTGLPRSAHSPAEKWETTRSRDGRVFPAALFFLSVFCHIARHAATEAQRRPVRTQKGYNQWHGDEPKRPSP